MHGLRHVLEQTEKNGVAIGHFNVSDLVLLKAIFEAAQELKVPVIVGLSEGERRLVGDRQIAALVRSLREEFDFPSFLMQIIPTPWQKLWKQPKLGLIRLYSTFPH
jgi:fructose-bisphosphate aldolase class II